MPPDTEMVCEYAVPVVPFGSELVPMTSGATEAVTVIESDCESVNFGEDESATCTVKVDVAAVVGVPEMTPALLRLRPVGRLPEVTVQAYGVLPPVATSVVE